MDKLHFFVPSDIPSSMKVIEFEFFIYFYISCSEYLFNLLQKFFEKLGKS